MAESIGFKVEGDAADAVRALLKVEKAQKRTERGAKKVSQATAKGTKQVKGFGASGAAGLAKVAAGWVSIGVAMAGVRAIFRQIREEQRKSSEAAKTFQQEFAAGVLGAGFDPEQARAARGAALGPTAAGLDPAAVARNLFIVEAQARAAGVKISVGQAGELALKAARFGQVRPAAGEEFAKIAGALTGPGVPVEATERAALRIFETKGALQFGKKQALTTSLLREAGVSQNEIAALFGAGSQNVKALTEFLDFIARGATKEARPVEKELVEAIRKGGIAGGLRFAQERPEFAKATIAVLQKNLRRELAEIEAKPLPDIEQRRRELAATPTGRAALEAARIAGETARKRTLRIEVAERDPELVRARRKAAFINASTISQLADQFTTNLEELIRPLLGPGGREAIEQARRERERQAGITPLEPEAAPMGFRPPGMDGAERAIREQTEVIRSGQNGNGRMELTPPPGGIPLPGGSADEP